MSESTEIRHRHQMPYGAELAEGGVRFRLWAPAAKSVDLMLQAPQGVRALPMSAQSEGWYELTTDAALAGSRYKFKIDGQLEVPDPAARANDDLGGASIVVDPLAYAWRQTSWRGRPWHEAIIYELHVGTFTQEGTYASAETRLDHLVKLGITVIELMPLAEFPGARGWGYDGVLPYSPDAAYGSPDELKSFIDAAHERGLAVMLDVVYNHFGPEGNYLYAYAPQFFTERHHTPWGAAINFDGEHSAIVRGFFIHNALYWFNEFRFDGLRLDAVHAMHDDGERHFVTQLSQTIHDGPGKDRDVYIVLENGANVARYLGKPNERDLSEAQWNDDVHHCLHVILTGETDGYYMDYAERPHAMLCRCLTEGFGYQGEVSTHEGGQVRGEPSAHLPPTAFINFLQNHDQIGNRAFGERLSALVSSEAALVAATSVLLLAPSPPLLFMGEEWLAPEPFVYFCDFGAELADKVREGRKREFAKFKKFASVSGDTVAGGAQLPPDPTDAKTFLAAKLDWQKLQEPSHAGWLEHYQRLLAVRQRDVIPRIPDITGAQCTGLDENGAFAVDWRMNDGTTLHLIANLNAHESPLVGLPAGRVIYSTHPNIRGAVQRNVLDAWSVTWLLERARAEA
ncbi:MAG: malto-oligosyltrehalose trehalohydrolase [Gammaproteobacteria bacterium]